MCIDELKMLITDDDVRGVVCSATGEIKRFCHRGVIDLFTLLTDEPDFLRGGMIADRVIGRGAALLLIKGGVAEVFAYVMSQPAFDVLSSSGIKVSYDSLQQNIINRQGTGICPVEQLTAKTNNPDVAYQQIAEFLKTKKP